MNNETTTRQVKHYWNMHEGPLGQIYKSKKDFQKKIISDLRPNDV